MSVRITRRDASVAASAALLAIGVARIVGADTAVMGSRAVAWDTLKPEPTKVGEVRHVFQAPTATLDELESHITTLKPSLNSPPTSGNFSPALGSIRSSGRVQVMQDRPAERGQGSRSRAGRPAGQVERRIPVSGIGGLRHA
jgi:hypothetical protein